MKPPPAILCIGRNYADHAAEMGSAPPSHPMVFMKNPASITGAEDAIVIPRVVMERGPQTDWEGELAIEIGSAARDVSEAQAFTVIAGYRVANDVSARWWQKEGSGGQFCRGKSFDTFCPVSPLRRAAEVPDPQALMLRTRVNGELMQEASTSLMLFSVARLVSELSRGTTLLPGTLILTGTPSGVGAARKPPRFLCDGDVVEVDIEGVGRLRNTVREEQ
jgi:2-keto-4-pentenoate hydratase/2-oxohepta-3-ene-1,7-dioic acid hydratase in catechol pathway